ncbi:hypothetical protein jhhlp_008180 [Lomentospora prolificans]|uniref:Zn(2)-C6 fungal-type domain-containing protein n=1 Tax=Lomentospora prolificans TaxID=41688 RepID=A0A2N3MZQ3_9PEZI|nr:hypothetical protein jhhlp_008180 [Lomentospora prolificans]
MDTSLRRVEKRNRPPVSCEPCRTRKLKCNRGLPCDTCIKRDKSSLCKYAPNATRNKPGPSKPRDLRDRLNTLENLVSSFISGDAVIQSRLLSEIQSTEKEGGKFSSGYERDDLAPNRGSAPSSTSADEYPLTPETPHLQETTDGQVNYIDPSHWLSILDDIKEVREHLSGSRNTVPQYHVYSAGGRGDASLLFSDQSLSVDEILTSLPSQPICDMLLSWYFNSQFMVLGTIDELILIMFGQYERFWDSPSTTSPLWVGLLFSILSITISIRQLFSINDPDQSIPPISVLQQRAIQCLVLGRYGTANSYALEAFILHLQSCYLHHDKLSVDPWFEMGSIIRLAFRMGYHRDPTKLAGISPFDGEMRRRVWLNIFQLDALLSFQMGFPSMIPTEFCDVQVPRNLDHSDLRIDMAELPPSRPLSEDTPVLYLIVKASVMAVFKKIAAHTQSLIVHTYDKTLALDAEMKRVYDAIPDMLKRRDVNRSFLDNSARIWQRASIEILHLKGLIVLHRRYINYDIQNPVFNPSRRSCIQAALDLLYRQADLHRACEPGGRLYEDRRMIFSLQIQDFLMAAMVLCLDLSVHMRLRRGTSIDGGEHQQLLSREYQALQASQRIWAVNSAANPEAHVAARALELMLRKVTEKDLGLFFTSDFTPSFMDSTLDSELPHAGAMSQMIDGSENIDWVSLRHVKDLY